MDEQPRYRTHIAVEEIQPSPTNPRKHFDETGLAELAASIKEHGFVTPILIRLSDGPSSPGTRMYELISGERRWRAAQIAGLRTIPAVIRDDLSPAAIIEIQLIENLQRADLHPLEEAEGYGRMMREHGYTADLLAEKIGKSRSYIFGRMKLLDLDEDGRRLFYGGLLNPSTALLIARIPSRKLQAKAIEDITRKDYNGDVPSVREAQRTIRNRYMLALDKAPFPTEDGELIATAGPCSTCPKRTGNNPDLFDDIDSANVCTDPDCHTAKKLAHSERRAKETNLKVITGAEAEKIMPSYSTESRTHAKLDSTCYDDPEHRTYRAIIGDDMAAITLIEHGHKGDLVEVVPKKVIAEKLKAAGIVTRKEVEKLDNKKLMAKVDLANAWRDKLFRKVRAAAASDVHADDLSSLMIEAMPIIALRFLTEMGFDRGGKVCGLWGAVGTDNYSRYDAFKFGLPNLSLGEQFLFALDLALVAEHRTDQYNYEKEPGNLITLAKALDIDPDALFIEAKEEQKAAETAKKLPKKAKKSPPAASEDHLPPTEAAQAQDYTREEAQDGATEAAPAGDSNQPENQTAEDQSSAAGAAVEKPSEAGQPLAVGDIVRVLNVPHPHHGLLPTAANKGGPVETIYYGLEDVVVMIEGDELIFHPSQLQLIAKAEAIETDAKPARTNRHTIQYQHPENDELCWSGRGKKPKWVKNWIAGGKTLDELKIGAAA